MTACRPKLFRLLMTLLFTQHTGRAVPAVKILVTDDIPPAPLYFPINAKINKEGYDSLDEVLEQGMKPLSVRDFKKRMKNNIMILDTRNSEKFTEGFIPGSLSIGLNGRFAEWAGSLLPYETPLLLVCDPGKEKESI